MTTTLAPDAATLAILRDYKRRLERRFGPRLHALYLYGSRARGDHQPDSDADLAGFFAGTAERLWELERVMADEAYEVLLETDLYIQPWAFPEAALIDPASHSNRHLTRAVLAEGVLV